MIDHLVIHVKDLDSSQAFYEQPLAVLGYELGPQIRGAVGFNRDGRPRFWLSLRKPSHTGLHVAFTCADRTTVDRFHLAALAAGGQDNGPPGVRTAYHPDYYGAFILDPDGNNIEAVCHQQSTPTS